MTLKQKLLHLQYLVRVDINMRARPTTRYSHKLQSLEMTSSVPLFLFRLRSIFFFNSRWLPRYNCDSLGILICLEAISTQSSLTSTSDYLCNLFRSFKTPSGFFLGQFLAKCPTLLQLWKMIDSNLHLPVWFLLHNWQKNLWA